MHYYFDRDTQYVVSREEAKFVCFYQIESNSIRFVKMNIFDSKVSFIIIIRAYGLERKKHEPDLQ